MKPRQPRYGDIFAGHDEGEAMAEQARVFWAEIAAELTERGLFKMSRARMVDRLVRLRVEYELHYPVAATAGPVRLSVDGNEYVNMLWSQCQKMNDQILKLEAALTLTPLSVGARTDDKPPASAPAAAKGYLDRAKSH